MPGNAEQFVRDVSSSLERPPPCPVRFFYTSLITLDDPLAPAPPPQAASSTAPKLPPRPFSAYDNAALDRVWHELRQKILKYNEEKGDRQNREDGEADGTRSYSPQRRRATVHREDSWQLKSASGARARPGISPERESSMIHGRRTSKTEPSGCRMDNRDKQRRSRTEVDESMTPHHLANTSGAMCSDRKSSQTPRSPPNETPKTFVTSSGGLETLDASLSAAPLAKSTTGTPFVRTPSRNKLMTLGPKAPGKHIPRPQMQSVDSYDWDSDRQSIEALGEGSLERRMGSPGGTVLGPQSYVPVGVSRLHYVVMPQLSMEPIYWSPVNDIAAVVRGTWFYSDSMLPVEVDVSNMLEAGYAALRPWTETWLDELNSAVEVGALGEMKIVHPLCPEQKEDSRRPSGGRQGTSDSRSGSIVEALSLEERREQMVNLATDLIDIASGLNGADNKASGSAPYGRDGQVRHYLDAGVIYANEKYAYILRPSLQPSAYYGRRPLANYIRKDRSIGIQVTRGFDQKVWDKLHPPKKGAAAEALKGVASSEAGAPPYRPQKSDPVLALSERPKVTDLVLVIHGIGQKLSERVASFHFTHAINAFRRDFNIELGNDAVKNHLRKDMGGIMVLPVNWRSRLKFDEGGYREGPGEGSMNQFTLKDITPETLPSVRNIVSDVMLDIPLYLSYHQPEMIAAVIEEANRIYGLWCQHNPGFNDHGRVHLIAHSLGSVMAVDILSKQPTAITKPLKDLKTRKDNSDHFAFNTHNLFLCGSPAGFFLLLNKAGLVPRQGVPKTDAEDSYTDPNVTGPQGQYGCLAVTNIYNVMNPYDPVAYRLNATVDTAYASSLKPAFVPSVTASWFAALNPLRSNSSATTSAASSAGKVKPTVSRLPSNVELETHNFTREQLAERRVYLLNDNGQIDFFLRYGGGPLDIQYLTMLGAHSSYWTSRDFVRFLVVEIGRKMGRQGTLLALRAVKKKGVGTMA